MFQFLLAGHVLSVFIGFGPIFAFPFIGVLAQKEPAHASVLIRLNSLIGSRLTIPLGLLAGLFGVLLFFNLSLDLTKNVWLGVAVTLYVLAMLGAILHQEPTAKRLIDLTDATKITPERLAEAQRLAQRLKLVGIVLTLMLLVIIVLMVTRPGFTA